MARRLKEDTLGRDICPPRTGSDRLSGLSHDKISEIPLNVAAKHQPLALSITPSLHLNIMVASMALGGAERYVHDMLIGLERRRPTGQLFIMHNVVPSYQVLSNETFQVINLAEKPRGTRVRAVALNVTTSPTRLLYTHLIRATDLRTLWNCGIATVPVIHNSKPGWQDPPAALDHDQVPFLVATSEAVRRQLILEGWRKPVVALRHELQRWRSAEEITRDREGIRRRHGIKPGTLLIGMVGQFKSHKAYTRAIRVLAEVRKFAKCKLMVLGGWDHDYGAGRLTYTATVRLALELGVVSDLIVLGPIQPVDPYYAAFDIFLNTSIYEGHSVATLEAAQSGCPLVIANVGGQSETAPDSAILIDDPSDIDSYVEAIRGFFEKPGGRNVLPPPPSPDLLPRLWCMIAKYGDPFLRREHYSGLADTLFITSNLNPGGAQRSLTNLLTHLVGQHRAWLCVLGRVLGDHFLAKLESSEVPITGMPPNATMLDRVEQVLELIERLGVRTVCFWNVEAPIKLLLAKTLALRAIHLIDVSPGPMLFTELDETAELQRRIAFSGAQYLERLDCFAAKYRGGLPPPRYGVSPRSVAIIPNGVPLPAAHKNGKNGEAQVRPRKVDPRFAIITCCRIVPNKRIEWLIDMMKLLNARIPGASLTIVGGVDQRHVGYWELISQKLTEATSVKIHFAGPNADVFSFLHEFKVFVMVSNAQGCPNASLEAMAAGLPVVANNDGGTGEQIVHGRTGYLVNGDDPAEMAKCVAKLLRERARAKRFGEAARRRMKKNFSMAKMVDNYRRIL